MATPAAVLSILVKTQGAQAAAGQLGALDKSGRKAAAGMKSAEIAGKRSSKTFSMIGKTAGLAGVTLGAAGLAGGIKAAVSEFREAQKVGAQTNAVLKSTKGAAKVTAEEVANLATQISKKTAIDDEQIQASENMLLTFTKLRNETGKGNDVFNQATQVVTDMSVALGQSGKSSAIQLGKALNDPIKGITALRRVGVSFTADQQKQIETMVKSGDLLGAQKRILRELTTEFGGSAAAQATAGDKFRVSLNNLAEAAGAVLVPQLDKAAVFFSKLMDQMVQGVGTGGAIVSTFRTAGTAIGTVYNALRNLIKAYQDGNTAAVVLVATVTSLTAAFVAYRVIVTAVAAATRVAAAAQAAWNVIMTANPIGVVIVGLAALAAAIVVAYKKSQTFRDVVDALWKVLRNSLVGAIKAVLGAFSSFLGAVSAVARAVGADGLADKAKQGQRAIDDLRDSLDKVPAHKDVEVAVKIKLDGKDVDVSNANPLSPTPPGGDGPGVIGSRIADAVRASKRVHDGAKKLVADGLGSMVPGIGGGGPVGSLMGANASLRPFAAVGAKFGLHVSSGKRNGTGTSYHNIGQAVDLANGRGPDAAKLATFRALKSRYGSQLAELIYTPGGVGIKDGQPFRYTGAVAADHYDHVHVAFAGGRTALGQAGNRGDGPGLSGVNLAIDAARKAGFKGTALVNMIAIAGRESGYNPAAQNLKPPDHSIGLWQINQLAHHGRFGTDAQLKNPYVNARAAYTLSGGGRTLSPWAHAGGPLGGTNVDAARKAVLAFTGTTSTGGAGNSAGSSNAASGAASAAARVNPFDQKMASADLAIEEAKRGPITIGRGVGARRISSALQQVAALTSKRKLIGARIRSIRKALKKGHLSSAKRLALTQELTQRLGEHAQLGKDIQDLRNPAAADTTGGLGGIGGDTATGDGSDPNQAQIDAINANTAAIEAQTQADKEHADALLGVKAELKRQTDYATSIANTDAFQIKKMMADLLSGQIGGYGVTPRSFTPGAGVAFRY